MPGRTLIQQVLGNAAVFNGTSGGGIRRSIVASTPNDYTATAWIYSSATQSGSKTIVKNGQTGNGNGGWNFYLNSSNRIALNDPGGAWGGTGTTTLANTTWYFVAFIRSGSTTQMYLNNVAEGSVINGSINDPQVDTTVGCVHNTTSDTYTNVFNGYIDDVRIYNRALSTTELGYLYTADTLHPVSTSGLQMWYKMDESTGATTVADSSGNGRTGTIVGTVTFTTGSVYIANIPPRTYVNAAVGKAFSFDGVSSNVRIPRANMTAFSGTHSVSLWIKVRSNSGTTAFFDSQWGNGGAGGWQFLLSGTNLSTMYCGDGTGTDSISPTSTSLATTFHHVVFVRNATTIKVYVDNVLKGTQSSLARGANQPTAQDLRFGGAAGGANFVDCEIDDVRIYNTELTATDVGNIFAGTPVYTGMIQRWSANGNALDFVGTAHGVETNTTYVTGQVYDVERRRA